MKKSYLPVLFSGKNSLPYLYKDEFTTPLTAGNVNNSLCEPGPGTRKMYNESVGYYATISDGKLKFQGASSYATPLYSAGPFTRKTGLAAFFTISYSTVLTPIGWGDVMVSRPVLHAFAASGGAPNILARAHDNYSSFAPDFFTTIDGVTYLCAIILRSSGAWWFIKGGVYTNWTLIWVSSKASSSNMYFTICSNSATVTNGVTNHLRVIDLGSPFDTDYGFATTYLPGTITTGNFVHTKDMVLEITVATLPSSGTIEIRFRVQDATNYWNIVIGTTGTITLNEVVNGTPTQRGTTSNMVTNGEKVILDVFDTTIKVYEGRTDSMRRITYTPANNFKNATSGVIQVLGTGAVVNNLVAWPSNPDQTKLSLYGE
jgi:hypothetical protein